MPVSYVTFWSKTINKVHGGRMEVLEWVDCLNNRRRSGAIVEYNHEGTLTFTTYNSLNLSPYKWSAWTSVLPGTVGEAMLKYVCRQAKKGRDL